MALIAPLLLMAPVELKVMAPPLPPAPRTMPFVPLAVIVLAPSVRAAPLMLMVPALRPLEVPPAAPPLAAAHEPGARHAEA